MSLHVYQIGAPYVPGRTSWPERAEYNYRGGGHELLLFYPQLTQREITAITRRPAEFGAVAVGPVLFFLYKFSTDSEWSDCPYAWHLVKQQRPDEATEPPPLEEGERALLSIVLVEATTGLIVGLRTVSLSIALARALHQAIRDQIAAPWDAAAYDRALQDVYRTTSVGQLARQAERCRIV